MIKYLGKICLCALSSVIGTMVGGAFSSALHLDQPKLPGSVNMQLMGFLCLVGGIVLSLALAELSRWLRGNRWARFAVIAWFGFAWLGINTTIEASVFTTVGGGAAVMVTMLFSSLFVAGAVVLLFGSHKSRAPIPDSLDQFFAHRTAVQWTIRMSAALLAFPVVYFFFGTPVGMIVGKYYRSHDFGLQMPSSLGVLIGVQILRSLISLFAALPILAGWQGSRRRFAWTFGLSLFVVSGLYGLIQAYWMPGTLRSIHSVELLLDSLAYGWLLAALLWSPAPAGNSVPAEKAAKSNSNVKLVA
jgi:hypothetical protein